MTRYYLVDDDRAVLNVLRIIVENSGGIVCGHAQNGEDALDDFPYARPDVVLVDLLMPQMDGITFVNRAREAYPGLYYVMLSQVSAKHLIAKAYEAGVEYFIQKPVNSVEVSAVLERLERYIRMDGTYRQMQNLFGAMRQVWPPPPGAGPASAPAGGQIEEDSPQNRAAAVLQKLGIGGDTAGQDIIRTVCYIVENKDETHRMNVRDLCDKLGDSPKAMEQRMRRVVAAGMVNLAHMGVEDYADETFAAYAGVLYRFEQMRREMDFIRSGAGARGRASLRTFLFALADLCSL